MPGTRFTVQTQDGSFRYTGYVRTTDIFSPLARGWTGAIRAAAVALTDSFPGVTWHDDRGSA